MTNTTEERKERRKLLVKALRSGRYKQGKHHLRDKDEYCCLGVACDVYANSQYDRPQWKFTKTIGTFLGQDLMLPPEVRDWFGFKSNQGSYKQRSSIEASLIILNDNRPFNFEDIADVIEKEPKGMFIDDKD